MWMHVVAMKDKMQRRLLSKALAALEWGWHEGLCLIDRGHDEVLRELLLYLNSKKRKWSASPVYRLQMADRQTGYLENTVKLCRLEPDPGTKPFGYNVWWFCRNHRFESVVMVPDCLCAVRVYFSSADMSPYIQLEYMEEEGCAGFYLIYYITVHDWIVRCSQPCECVDLLDAIDPSALHDDFVFLFRTYHYFRHLESLLCHNDPPRLAYIQRKMSELERGYGGYEYWI
jgi:hypothetical protein